MSLHPRHRARLLLWRALAGRHRLETDDVPVFSGWAPRISNAGRIKAGSGLRVLSTLGNRVLLATEPGALIELGDDVLLSYGTGIHSSVEVSIGSHSRIAGSIVDTDFHPIEQGTATRKEPVRIGRNVWLAAAVMVLPGVEIGAHTVVAAGSIVPRSLPDHVLAAGNPAKPIREIEAADDWIRR